jgi:hypothetical protein
MHRQFFFALFASLFALLSAANISAQSVDTPAQSMLLPDRFGSWQTGNHPPIVRWPRSEAAAALDSHPEYTKLLVESGLVRVEDHYYQKDNQDLTVGLFKLRDSSGAYQVYTTRLQPGMVPGHLRPISAMNSHNTILLVGNLLLEVTQGASDEDLRALVEAVQPGADKTPLPPIREYLPKEDLVNATQRYALGSEAFRAAAEAEGKPEIAGLTSAVGFAQGAEAMLAQYHNGRNTGVLLLIDYPTPQLAELHMRHLETALSEGAKTAGSVIERKGSLLSVVIAPSSSAYAESLRAAVNYETQVTWNEPSQTATDPPWAMVLYRIFVGTGVFMVMAIAFGVAFGGFRIFIKRMLPGKIFDRPEQMEVLQLGLSGNKIDTRDLY